MTDLAPLQVGVVPEGRYAQGSRSPIVWVWLCARCAGYAPTRTDDRLSMPRCHGCGFHVPELCQRFLTACGF